MRAQGVDPKRPSLTRRDERQVIIQALDQGCKLLIIRLTSGLDKGTELDSSLESLSLQPAAAVAKGGRISKTKAYFFCNTGSAANLYSFTGITWL